MNAASRRPTLAGVVSSGASLLGAAALLLWPAALNRYPIVFSDTGAFLAQTIAGPYFIWDKPWIYGPALHALHWRVLLWGPVLAQGVLLAWLLRLVARALGWTAPTAVLTIAVGLAACTAAPWFAALLMPDMFAPALVLALFLLGFAESRLSAAERAGVFALATFACAVHLAHLPLAAALIALVLLVRRRWRPALRCALPLVVALALLVVSNGLGTGRWGVSPHGAVFAAARLIADGPGARTLATLCPGAGWHACAWVGRLPTDSDAFLWDAGSPVWATAPDGPPTRGPIAFSTEAGEIVRATLRREPLAVAGAALHNTWAQLGRARVGDTLVPDHLDSAIVPRLALGFPPAEGARFAAGLQARGTLPAAAEPFLWPHAPVLLAGAVAALFAWWRAVRQGEALRLGLVLCVLVGVTANAFATGALSGPHDRYGARIAWLLPLAAALCLWPQRRPVP